MTNNKKPIRYTIGGEFGDKYLTRQEARCMACFLKGATMKRAANTLGLSPRTIEYYTNNMKQKLDLSSKYELVLKIAGTPFAKMANVDPMSL